MQTGGKILMVTHWLEQMNSFLLSEENPLHWAWSSLVGGCNILKMRHRGVERWGSLKPGQRYYSILLPKDGSQSLGEAHRSFTWGTVYLKGREVLKEKERASESYE